MRILQLSIKGFGQLRGEYSLDPGAGKLGLLLERNEAGKTTLMEAILAALYGLNKDRRRAKGKLSEWEVYRPWDGGPYGLVLRLQHGAEELTIERDFREDSVRVLAAGENISDRFRSGKHVQVGELLLGISREHFLHSAFIRQGEVGWGDASGLSEAIQRMADSQSLESTAAAALRALEKGLAEYEGTTLAGKGKVETEIARCDKDIADIENELGELHEQRQALSERIEALRKSESRKQERQALRGAIESARLRLRLRELEEELAALEQRREELAKLQRKVEEEADLAALSPESFQEAETACNRWQGAQRTAESYSKDAREAEAECREKQRARDELGLKRLPRAEDVEALSHASARLKDIRKDQERLEERAQREREAIREEGFDPDQASTMLEALQYLTEEDRELLRSHTRRDLEIDELRESSRQDLSLWQRQIDEIHATRMRRRRWGGVTAAVGAALLATGLLLSQSFASITSFLPYLAGAVIALGLYFLLSAKGMRAEEELVAAGRVADGSKKVHEIEERNQEHELAWQDLAYRLGIPTDELYTRYQSLRLVERNLDTLAGIDERQLECEKQEEETLKSVGEAWEVFGGKPKADELEQKLNELREAMKLTAAAAVAEANARSRRELAEEKDQALKERRAQAREALERCLVELLDEDDAHQSARKLKERTRAAEEARSRRNLSLPKLKESTPGEETLAELRQRVREAESALRAHADDAPVHALESTQEIALPAELSVRELREKLEDRERELTEQDQLEAQRREDSLTTVRAFLRHYEEKVGPLNAQLEELRAARRRAQEFKNAVTLAHDALNEISRETYAAWAIQLNQEAQVLLGRLGTGSRDIHFNENLEFELMHEQKLLTKVEVDQQLSAGARDGVYLAARLAVSHLLSGDEGSLPLILDDPFAHADDARLIAGLKMLLSTVADRQQVLLLACQHSRYEWAIRELGQPAALSVLSFTQNPVGETPGGQLS